MPTSKPRPSAQAEILALFAELTDPEGRWCTDEESIDRTVYDLVLGKLSFGDRDRAGRFLAVLVSVFATTEEQRNVLAALKRDRDQMRANRAAEIAEAAKQWSAA